MKAKTSCIENEIDELLETILVEFSRGDYPLFRFDSREADFWEDAEMESIQKSLSLKIKDKNAVEFEMLDSLYNLLRRSLYDFNKFEQYSDEGRRYELNWVVKKE
ncbi:MAG: hypothetical protein KA467_00200 [Bacteroidales bacterium]|nr:hypothetical protein [Bacteroidales bacterium]